MPSSALGQLGVYFNDNLSRLYTSEFGTPGKLSIWPSGQTLPSTGTMSCNAGGGWGSMPYGIAGDKNGNIYVSHNTCNTLVAWLFNSTTPIRLGGTGSGGPSAQQLSSPRHIYLDEDHGFIYVADTGNNRIQRFSVNGNGTGVTVAGGNGAGTALNQLNYPTGVYVSKKDGSIYISECNNNRVSRWGSNATSGTVVAGSAGGTSGSTASLLNQPFAVILDRNETWMYIADYNNHRVQRFLV
jgi:DNA-binding beta-propeller fold protein YncE